MNDKNEIAKTLSALRMGVIPSVALEEIMVGREKESEEMNRFIKAITEEGTSGIRFINGAYGTGKSFMLEMIKQHALKQGYVVANLSVNSGFNMSKFDVFYTNIMSHLSLNMGEDTKTAGFEEIFNGWVKQIKQENQMEIASRSMYNVIHQLNTYNSAFATVLTIYIRSLINKDRKLAFIASAWIRGDRNISYELKKQLKVKGSVDVTNAMEVFKGFVKMLTLIGYKGLIVTIDEAELMMQLRSDIRMKAYGNIRYIMDACGVSDLENCGFFVAGTEGLFTDTEKGFPSYDALYQRLGENITNTSKNDANIRQTVMHLRTLDEADFYKAGQRIWDIHKAYYAYETEVAFENVFNLVIIECRKDNQGKSVTIRYFVKKMIEMLDLLEANPDMPIFKTKVKLKSS